MGEDKLRLAEAGIALGELAAENRRFACEVAQPRVELEWRKDLEYRDGSYFILSSDALDEGPVCRRCYISEGLINRLRWGRDGSLECTVCGTKYNPQKAGEYDPPPEVTFV